MPIDQQDFQDALYDWVANGLALEKWQAATAYKLGERRRNGGNVYQVSVAGISDVAPATGPAGNGAAIVDGGVTWSFLRAGESMFSLIWKNQDATAPTGDAALLEIGTIRQVHQAANTNNYSAGRPAGEEIEQRVSKDFEVILTIELITDDDAGRNTARAIGMHTATRLELPSSLEILRLAGISLLDVGQMPVSGVLYGPDFEGRAILDVRLLVRDTASDFTGYIASAAFVDGTAPP